VFFFQFSEYIVVFTYECPTSTVIGEHSLMKFYIIYFVCRLKYRELSFFFRTELVRFTTKILSFVLVVIFLLLFFLKRDPRYLKFTKYM